MRSNKQPSGSNSFRLRNLDTSGPAVTQRRYVDHRRSYCYCQQTPSHQCSREFLSLAACVKYKVTANIQGQGGPRTTLKAKAKDLDCKAKAKDLMHQGQGQGQGFWPQGPKSRPRTNVTDFWAIM